MATMAMSISSSCRAASPAKCALIRKRFLGKTPLPILPRFRRCLGIALLVLSSVPATAWADKIWMEGANGNPLIREGKIVDIIGSEIRLQMLSGKVDTLPLLRVKRIEPSDDVAGQAAEKLVSSGDFRMATPSLKRAITAETRPWRQRQLRLQLVICHHELGEIPQAGEEFLSIVESDPSTLAWGYAPLAWHGSVVSPQLEQQAEKWLAKKTNPAAQLLGGSWLLPTSKRSAAMSTLANLASNPTPDDPRISALAEMQLWRTKIVTARPTDLANWQQAIDQVPSELRAGPLFVLGDAIAYAKQPELAALTYLKIPLVYEDCRPLCAAALLAAATQQQLRGDAFLPASELLLQELQKKYPLSPAAEEATRLLEKSAAKKAKAP